MTATPSITADPEYAKTQQESLALYESLDGVTNLDRRAETCYEACRNLYDEPTIARIASAENEYLRSRFKITTLGTQLSKHGYYKRFRSILLKDGLNGYLEEKHDGSRVLKHLFFKYCGLTPEEWVERNETDRVISRLGNAQTLNPEGVIDKAIALIQSDDHWEIAAGLIALTGRRPHEIVARAKFTVDGEYQVTFEGQGKKRGEKPVFAISTLAPAEAIVSTLKHLRNRTEIKSLLKEVRANNPRDLVRQNDEIDRRTNKCINRAVKREFGSVLPTRERETEENCKALRAAYSAIATRRDIPNGSIGEQMLYAARLLGHFVGESPSDSDLKHIATTIGYSDYRVNGEVPYPPMPESIPYKKLPQIRVTPETKEQIARWSELWECTYHEVLARLVVAMSEKLETPPEPEPHPQPEAQPESEVSVTSEDKEMTPS
ncbi:MAG: protelomerase family protein, partial [Cyanobacteriota bacterium]|nr:protelomerase family protein [Cyanobacteriota bacterium]